MKKYPNWLKSIANFMAQFRWFRKKVGGHWERRIIGGIWTDWYKCGRECNFGKASTDVQCEKW